MLSPPVIVPPLATSGWQKNPVFLRISGISKDDLKNGTGVIEKLKYPPWDSRNKEGANKTGDAVGYGKYSHLSFAEVKKQDPRYFSYMVENVPRFRLRAKELNLLD